MHAYMEEKQPLHVQKQGQKHSVVKIKAEPK